MSLVLLAAAPAAVADTFYVDATADGTGTCTAPGADACKTIVGAVVKARATTGGDTIYVAAGTYHQDVFLNNANDAGTAIVGAGPTLTTILHGSGDGNYAGVQVGVVTTPVAGVSFADLKIEQGANGGALDLRTTAGSLSNVAIAMTSSSNTSTAIQMPVGDATFDHLNISGAWTGTGVSMSGATVHMNDSTIATNGGMALNASGTMNPTTADLKRDRLSIPATATGWVIQSTNTSLTIDSSLITGGYTGLMASASGSGASSPAQLRNVTIDAGQPGSADASHYAAWASAGTGATSAITLDSSITLEQQRADAVSSVTCTNSDVPLQSAGTIACTATDSSSSATVLFANATAGDYHLATSPVSPAIETGSTEPLATGESATDLEGSPRVTDGDFDCMARRDKGAYEVQTLANTPPTAAITAPPSAYLGDPVSFTGQVSDAETPLELTFAWTFSDGATATTQDVSHAFSALGDYDATFTVTDPHGCFATATRGITIVAKPPPPPPPDTTPTGPPPPPPPPRDLAPPLVSAIGLTNKAFAVGPSKGRRPPRGTRFAFTLSEPASVKITVERAEPGRKVGKTCRKPTAKLRGRKACTRWIARGTLSATAVAGRNTVAFSGRLRGRALPVGSYRARIVATDAAGNTTAPSRAIGFRIVRG